jgi:glutathione S-transferase
MSVRLYVTSLSNPSKAAVAMLAHKRLPHRLVTLTSGFHPWLVRAAGFQGRTVPALELADGRRIQGSLAISRVLDDVVAERPLFPREPTARRAVEEAERWGHDELQPVPRRIFRWAAARDPVVRRWVAADVARVPAPAVMAALTQPLAARLSREGGGGEEAIRADVRRLPELLDRVDALVAAGTIGGPEPNAADFQILSSVRVLLDFKALPRFEHRPSAQRARRLFPQWEGEMPAFEVPGA